MNRAGCRPPGNGTRPRLEESAFGENTAPARRAEPCARRAAPTRPARRERSPGAPTARPSLGTLRETPVSGECTSLDPVRRSEPRSRDFASQAVAPFSGVPGSAGIETSEVSSVCGSDDGAKRAGHPGGGDGARRRRGECGVGEKRVGLRPRLELVFVV